MQFQTLSKYWQYVQLTVKNKKFMEAKTGKEPARKKYIFHKVN